MVLTDANVAYKEPVTMLLQAAVSFDHFILSFGGKDGGAKAASLELNLDRVPDYINGSSDFFVLNYMFTMNTAANSNRDVSCRTAECSALATASAQVDS